MSEFSGNPLATRTIERVSAGLQSGRVPCLPELVQLIHALSSKPDISVPELAELVEKDIAVMTRVLAAANTLGYNPGAIQISTVAQAIQVIGFEHIRSLAMALMLMRHAESAQDAEEQRQATLLALSAGLVAQALARTHNLADPELAFIAASLRHFGRLLLTAFMAEEYREACRRARTMEGDEAFRQVLGLTPLALGRTLLRSTHLPKVLLDALRDSSPQVLASTDTDSAPLLVAAEFSGQLCALAMRRDCPAEEFAQAAWQLAARFKKHFTLTAEDIERTLGAAGERLARFNRVFGVQNFAREHAALLRHRAQHLEPSGDPPMVPTAAGLSPPSPEATPAHSVAVAVPPVVSLLPPGEPIVCTPQLWQDGLAVLSDQLAQPTIDYVRVCLLAMECVQAGFNAPEAVFFSLENDQRHFVAVYGKGRVFRQLRGDRAIRQDEQTVLGVCLRRRENVVIHQTTEAKTAAYLPAWCRAEKGLGSFILLPLHDPTRCFALLLIGWPEPRQIVLTADHTRLMRALLSLVAAARRLGGLG